jgi:hypothetical protein
MLCVSNELRGLNFHHSRPRSFSRPLSPMCRTTDVSDHRCVGPLNALFRRRLGQRPRLRPKLTRYFANRTGLDINKQGKTNI